MIYRSMIGTILGCVARWAVLRLELKRMFYGSPDETLEELCGSPVNPDDPPEDGDELCDGHQAHYVWAGGWM